MIHLFFALAAPLLAQEPQPVTSSLQEVTIFPGTALVRRSASLPSGGGAFLVEGLPWSMDPESVRVRCAGGEVVGIETRERVGGDETRLADLRAGLRELERELAGVQDEGAVLDAIAAHLRQMLTAEARNNATDAAEGRADPEAWAANLAYLTEQLAANHRARRAVEWRAEEVLERIEAVRLDLGGSGRAPRRRDVIVQVVGEGARGATLDVEYLVQRAGWKPVYDLRTAPNARSVELSYRAQVWQQSGEDWNDVTLLLSTARPHMGAQGPDPEVQWVGLTEPRGRVASRTLGAELEALGYDAEEKAADMPASAPPFASVQSEGLSVRFRIAARESIESRPQPSTVLIGRAELAVTPEYYAVPALDENVWLRGRTTNATEWSMLAGRASVYFGADFIGHAELEAVQPGEDLTLHLGPDPALTVERVRTEDMSKQPGILGTRVSRTEAWRIRIENHGAAAVVGGAARLIVHEVLPRSRDERLKVELLKAEPAVSTAERWKQDREEKGVLTWEVQVRQDAAQEITWRMRLSHPKGTEVYR